MKIAVIADVHCHNFPWCGGAVVAGLNERCLAVIHTVHSAVDLACAHNCEELVVAGDLVDVDAPIPQILAGLIPEFQRFPGDVHILVGNHDQHSSMLGDHALGPLHDHHTENGRIRVHDVAAFGESDCGFLPFRPDPVQEWLEAELSLLGTSVAVAHFGISDDSTPDYLCGSHDQIHVDEAFRAMKATGTRLLVVGNWHNAASWSRDGFRIVQVGALVPTGFDNPGRKYGGVVIVDTSRTLRPTFQHLYVPGPRFLKESWATGPQKLEVSLALGGSHVYFHLEASPADLGAAKSWAEAYVAKTPTIKGYKVTPIRGEVAKLAAKAAKASAQEDNRDAAIAKYIASIPLDAGVSRRGVLRRTLGYLARRVDHE